MIAPPVTNAQSDTDSDSDWDEESKKITITIKPITQISPSKTSASVDELRATVKSWKSMANLIKPNSRRHHEPSLQPNKQSTKLPVAFAIQECLHVDFIMGQDQEVCSTLIGHVKLAVHPSINSMSETSLKNQLEISILTNLPWNDEDLTQDFIEEQTCPQALDTPNSVRVLHVDMRAVRKFTLEQANIKPHLRYFLLPELLRYTIRSHQKDHTMLGLSKPHINPLHVTSHWLCDLNMTKVRVDISAIESVMDASRIKPSDIKSLKIIMDVNGGVVSYQSKPEANWNAVDSKLTWSFNSLADLIDNSQSDSGVSSCLARFELDDGPSTPGDINLQFQIADKTISGTRVIINSLDKFSLSKQKFEVRTGSFISKPPDLFNEITY